MRGRRMTADIKPARGMVLPYVLWAILIVSSIAMAVLPQSVTAARIERNAWDRFERSMAMEAALHNAVFNLIAAENMTEARIGAARPCRFGDYAFEIIVEDELGKVDLNAADENLIRRALRAAGAGPSTADAIAADIVEWRGDETRPSNRQENRNGPFQSIEETRLIEGMTDNLYDGLAPLVTVHAQARFVDPATAPPPLLRALPGLGPGRIAEIMKRRTGSPEDEDETAPLHQPMNGRAFTISVTMREPARPISAQTIVRLTGNPNEFYWVMEQKRY